MLVQNNQTSTYAAEDRGILQLQDLMIYDEGGIIAINKPAGLVSMGGCKGEFSVATGLEQLICDEWPHKPHLAHRLDRFTSGVLLLARTKGVARSLQNAFRNRDVQKEYWALVDGVPDSRAGVIDQPVVDDEFFMSVGDTGKEAQTEYQVVSSNTNGVSFLSLKPHTGRKHQLRVHTAQVLETPILGDRDYHPVYHERTRLCVSRSFVASVIAEAINSKMDGQMLHARSIAFQHPRLDEVVTVTAPLPTEREKVWQSLGFDRDVV